jgi:hypothetical protein
VALTYAVVLGQLEADQYGARTTLKVRVYADDVAQQCCFCVAPVGEVDRQYAQRDGGVVAADTR